MTKGYLSTNINDILAAQPVFEADPAVLRKIKRVEQDTTKLNEYASGLEAYSNLLRQSADTGVTHQTAAFLKAGLEMFSLDTFDPNLKTSLECFTTARKSDRRYKAHISTEDLKETATAVGEFLLEHLKKLIALLEEVYQRILGPKKKTYDKADYIAKAIPKFPGYPGGKMRGEVPAPPPTVKSNLNEIAEKKAGQVEDEEQENELIIRNPGFLYADGKNTYDNIKAEKEYIEFINTNIPMMLENYLKYSVELINTRDSVDAIKEGLFEQISNITKSAATSLTGSVLPGDKQAALEVKEDFQTFVLEHNDANGYGDEVVLELRPNSKLKSFAEECRDFLKEDWISLKKESSDYIGQLIGRVNSALKQHKDKLGDIMPLTRLIMMGMRAIMSTTFTGDVELCVVKSVNSKLTIIEAELAHY